MKTILLAEDDPFIVDIYSTALRQEGYKVDVALDGETAFKKIKNTLPDLLILDMKLPKIDGIELLKMIRQDPQTKNLKVIVVSNFNPRDLFPDTFKLNVIKCFLKVQTTPEDVVKEIREILK